MAAEVEGDGVPKALKNLLQRARFCTSHCQCVKREGFGHKSRSGHELRLLTAPEKEALKTQWLDEQALGKAGAAHLEEDRQGQLERREAAGVQHTEKLDQPWKLDFGKHKGKTLEQTDKADSGYLLHLVCSRVHEQRPTFRKALQETGRLDDALSKAPLLRHQSALRVLERSSLEDECGPSHPDVRKLRALQVAEAEAVLAEEAGSQQAEVQGQLWRCQRSRRDADLPGPWCSSATACSAATQVTRHPHARISLCQLLLPQLLCCRPGWRKEKLH
jgi:hypothetical protein